MQKNYLENCNAIHQNCEYTAEAHHIIAEKNKRLQKGFQLIPAIFASFSSLLVVGTIVPDWVGWFAVISAVITAVASVLNPLKEYYDHLNAAKNFTALKHEAKILKDVSSLSKSEKEFSLAVENLNQRYNDLIRFVPPTDNKSFEKARKRIKEGIHKSDKLIN